MYLDQEESKQHLQENWVFVMQAVNENEANVIESILDSEEIPVVRKYQKGGDYLKIVLGTTPFGIDIFVPESMEGRAKGLLETEPDEAEYEEEGIT